MFIRFKTIFSSHTLRWSIIRATAIYVAFSVLWIVLSDLTVFWLPIQDDGTATFIGIVKGILFVVISGLLIYAALSRELLKREKLMQQHSQTQLDLLDQLQVKNEQIKTTYEHIMQGWAKTLEIREKETAGHSQRVVCMTEYMLDVMHIPYDKGNGPSWGALLHDIGKVGIPDSILLKPGPLTPEERAIMETHTTLAEELFENDPYLETVRTIAVFHHERWDGSGYPKGLQGDAIPLLARIFAVIDVADAMGSDRPYRKALPISVIYDHLQKEAGRLYDPQVVEIFIRHDVMRKANGLEEFYISK